MHDRNRTCGCCRATAGLTAGLTAGRPSSAGNPPFMFNFAMEIPLSGRGRKPIRRGTRLVARDSSVISCEISVFSGWRYYGYLCFPRNRAWEQSGENLQRGIVGTVKWKMGGSEEDAASLIVNCSVSRGRKPTTENRINLRSTEYSRCNILIECAHFCRAIEAHRANRTFY